MKRYTLLLSRLALGGLMVWWGLDKILHMQHALAVSQSFYLGWVMTPAVWRGLGGLQVGLGILLMLGVGRRWTYPLLLLVTGVSLLAVWRSVVDPFGWWSSDTELLFYPSIIIFASAAVLAAFRDEDRMALGTQPPE
jgi:putative oxidoreductase